MDDTLQYYNNNAKEFVSSTLLCDVRAMQDEFLSKLQPKAHILDLGCGWGRDSKYFIEKGFKITAIDGSIELCKLAAKTTGQEVICMTFDKISDEDQYDAIWACASLLHLPYSKLGEVLKKCILALKKDGIFYLSFKYGDFEGMRDGRYFTDLTPERFDELLDSVEGIKVLKYSVSSDVNPERKNQKWLNVFLKKWRI